MHEDAIPAAGPLMTAAHAVPAFAYHVITLHATCPDQA